MKATLVGGGVILAFGILLGNMSAPDAKPEFIKVPVTKTITETKEVKVAAPFPESCHEALRLGEKLANKTNKMYANGNTQLKIISDARMILADGGDLAVIENRQRRFSGRQVGLLSSANEEYQMFTIYLDECKDMTE